MDGTGGILKGHEVRSPIRPLSDSYLFVQVIGQLRQSSNLQNAIIIGCTSNVNNHRDALLHAGANAVWSKPIPSPAILQVDLKKLLSQSLNGLNIE